MLAKRHDVLANIGKWCYDCGSAICKLVNPVTDKTLSEDCDRSNQSSAMNAHRTHNGFRRIGWCVSGDISQLVVVNAACNDRL